MVKPITVKEIVLEYLRKHGQDGLCNDNCGCSLEDFMPCECNDISTCEPARRIKKGSKQCVKCENKKDCFGECFIPV